MISVCIRSAELCHKIDNVIIKQIDVDGELIADSFNQDEDTYSFLIEKNTFEIEFSATGFVKKKFIVSELPEIIRLLDDKLIGYQNRLWFLPEESVEVFIHAPESYKATLFRHGIEKKEILQFNNMPSQQQKVPDSFFVATGLEWEKSFSYTLPSNVESGIYSILLESKNQEEFAIPFIVSTSPEAYGQNSKLLVLASTNTWQSYNLWGGRSRYRNFEDFNSKDFLDRLTWKGIIVRKLVMHLPESIKKALKKLLGIIKPQNNSWVHDRLSIRRPFINCSLEGKSALEPFTNHLAAAEWRVLAWLEKENIAYDFVSGAELNSNPNLLGCYQAVIFSSHCEYWSRKMYQAVNDFHNNHGLWILNISGNTMYREIEFFKDGSTRCTSLHFTDSCADETQLLGVRFTELDYASCAPYRILKKQHWVFNDIPCSENDNFFGGLSLNQNTTRKYSRYDPGRPGMEYGLSGMGSSGWETDKLSKTAPKDIICVAKGMNKGGGADMVVRESHGNRGGLFSASSLIYGGSLLIDSVSATMVKNVLKKALILKKVD